MSNKIQKEINKIDIPKELSERSKLGISQAKQEMHTEKPANHIKRIGLVGALFAVVSLIIILNQTSLNHFSKEDTDPIVMLASRPSYTLWELAHEAEIIANLTVTERVEVLEANQDEQIIQELSVFKASVNHYLYNELGYDHEIKIIQPGGPNGIDAENPLLKIGESYILFLVSREDSNLEDNLDIIGGPYGRYNKVGDRYVRQLSPKVGSASSSLTEAELIERLNQHNEDLKIDLSQLE